MVTGRPFRIESIRAGRRKPGLLRQHLAAVRAAAQVSGAEVEGGALASSTLTFRPGAIRGGEFRFDVGSAGSSTLVLQTVLPALATAAEPSTLRLSGGTHNPFAPPFEFLQRSFAPLIGRCGPGLRLELTRPGFYPAGGGSLLAEVTPAGGWSGFELLQRGRWIEGRMTAVVARLPESIARREMKTAMRELGWSADRSSLVTLEDSAGPGNALSIELRFEQVTEVVTGFGMRGVRAETVAEKAAAEAKRYLDSAAPVGPHLADQLMLPLALAGRGRFRTMPPTSHARTNAEVIGLFLERELNVRELGNDIWEVSA